MLRQLLFIVAALSALTTFGQAEFSVGIHGYAYQGKLVLPERAYHGNGDFSQQASVAGGIFAQIHLGYHFTVRAEVSSSSYEFTADNVNIPPVFEPEKYSDVVINYATTEFPIMGIYYFREAGIKPFLGGGVGFGFNRKTDFTETAYGFEDFRGENAYPGIHYEWDKTVTGFLALAGVSFEINQHLLVNLLKSF